MRQGYSKYAFASAFCTWAIMLVIVFLYLASGKRVNTPEFWLLVAMSGGLLRFAWAMIRIMWPPAGEEVTSSDSIHPFLRIVYAESDDLETVHQKIRLLHRGWVPVFTLMQEAGREDLMESYRIYLHKQYA